MTVRSINSSAACASTVAKLDPSITVAHTGTTTMLLNLPRDIAELDKASKRSKRGFFDRLRSL